MTDKQIITKSQMIMRIAELSANLEVKEKECERLKKTIDDLLHKPEIRDKILWKIDNEALLGSKDAVIYKLEQILTEIKEIAEKIDDSGGCDYGDYDCDNCSSLEQETVCTYKVKKLILQKISEVL